MQESHVVRMKILLLVSSLVCLGYLFLAAYEENFTSTWREHQRHYAQLLDEQSQGETSRAFPVEMRQVYLEDWGIVDRCVNCHAGIDNPTMADQLQPLTSHSGDFLKHHPPDRFGCTVCHQGQGRATDKDAAHGRVPFWTEPLLVGDFAQATCAKCHHEDEVPRAPALNRGKRLMAELGCMNCHETGLNQVKERSGPRLSSIGSKVSRKWLDKWLANPKDYLPLGKMPCYELRPYEVTALAAYLMTFRSESIDAMSEPEGDYDAGADVYRESQCIVCHVTKLDRADNPIGGQVGPSLLKIGNKVNKRWLATFFKNPHAFLPNTKMPRFHFSDKEVVDLAQYVSEEWVDYDLLDAEDEQPEPPAATAEQIETGRRLFAELDCAGCHLLTAEDAKPDSPDLTYIGSTLVHQLAFGEAKVRHTLPDFFYTKLKAPRSLHHAFKLPPNEAPSEALWRSLRPISIFSEASGLPKGSENERLAWILQQAQQTGVLAEDLKLPDDGQQSQADWLVGVLEETGALNPLRMPDFKLSDADAAALTIALMSLSDVTAPSKRFEVQPKSKSFFNPQDKFGQLERRYRCLSCHKIRDSGDLLASDISQEGSRVNREWLYHYLNNPYSMRRMLTIAMPIFHFPDEESRFMADYMSQVFVDTAIGAGWTEGRDKANEQRGQKLFQEKGCIACHQVHSTGGDVGPSLTTQVPEFPHGTWVGDKLRPEWIYQWLKNPQALLPDTIEPNLGLGEQELLDLTAYILSLKNPEFQQDRQEK